MQKRIEIQNASLTEDALRLKCGEDLSGAERKASGQMLVDSDHFAFVYILESADSFEYVIIKEHIWPDLKEALDQRKPAVLEAGGKRLNFQGCMKNSIIFLKILKIMQTTEIWKKK